MATAPLSVVCPFCRQVFLLPTRPAGPAQAVSCPYCRQLVSVIFNDPHAGGQPTASQAACHEASIGQPSQPETLRAHPPNAAYLSPWEAAETLTTPNDAPALSDAEWMATPDQAAASPAGPMNTAAQASPEDAAPGRLLTRAFRKSTRWLLLIAATLLVAAVVFWGGRQWLSVSSRPTMQQASSGTQPIIKQSVKRFTTSDLLAGHWTDASRATVKLGVYEIRVLGAELGPVLGRDQQRRVTTVADLGLQVFLEIRNRSDEPTSYRSWYTVAVQGEQTVGVDLLDNVGNRYPLLAFPEGMQLRNHTVGAELDPGQRVRDVLIFHIPSEVDRSQVRDFFLWLDAASQGGEGELRFKIPSSMVRNW